MSDLISSGLTTVSLIALATIVITIAVALEPPEEEYDPGEGYNPETPEDRDEREEKERKYATKALDKPCSGTSECSRTGKFGGDPSGPLDRIHCDEGQCRFDRKDWLQVIWFPPSKCVGKIFGKPGTCRRSDEEEDLRRKLMREGEYESRRMGVSGRSNLGQRNFRNYRNGR